MEACILNAPPLPIWGYTDFHHRDLVARSTLFFFSQGQVVFVFLQLASKAGSLISIRETIPIMFARSKSFFPDPFVVIGCHAFAHQTCWLR